MPHVPGRDRGHPEAADGLLDAGQGRHGRPHADRARARPRSERWSSSCSSTTRSTARSATRAASARCRTSPSAGAAAARRFIEPKRHFQKPLALSPLIAIDRERCILCYRCVRFSQEVAEDYQLVLLERGAHTLRRHLRRPPLRGAVQRQHHRAVPGGRADLAALPLPRAPVGHRGRGLGLHAVPGAVQRRPSPSATSACCACWRATTPRSTTAGCATRAASPTRPMHVDERITQPLRARRRRAAPGRRWERALDEAAAGAAARRRAHAARWPAARPPTRRASCCSACCARAWAPPHLDSRAAARCPRGLHARSPRPDAAGDGRRPRVRPHRARARLRAGRRRADPRPAHPQGRAPPRRRSSPSPRARPASLDPNAKRQRALRAGRGEAAFVAALAAALVGGDVDELGRARAGRRAPAASARWPSCCATGGEDVVILYGERLLARARGPRPPRRC